MKLGLIQTRGIGDIVIALPAAQALIAAGNEIYWPIDESWIPDFAEAEPAVHWLPVTAAAHTQDYFLHQPRQLLATAGCDRQIVLYSYLTGLTVENERAAASLKFDEYKYAVCGVPFMSKWQLRLARNAEREDALREDLGLSQPYAVIHLEGSNTKAQIEPSRLEILCHGLTRIEIAPGTARLLDWLGVIDGAACIIMIDSVFSNLVEQLGLAPQAKKYLVLRSPALFTPVYARGWQFL